MIKMIVKNMVALIFNIFILLHELLNYITESIPVSTSSVKLNRLRSFQEDKIPAVPFEFEYIPVEIVSKEFTKLNSSHSYRVHYLGPRPLNSLMLHKKYGRSQDKEENMNFSLLKEKGFKHYQVNLKKIINCNFTNVKFM